LEGERQERRCRNPWARPQHIAGSNAKTWYPQAIKPGNSVFHPIHDLRGNIKPGHAPTSEDRRPGTISLNTPLFFVTGFKPFFVRSYNLSKYHSFYSKDAKNMIIYDHWSNMITILRKLGLPLQPFNIEYSLTNQYVGSSKVVLIKSGTKFAI
jgi:hypothetical protein